jgi:hypothetical protein
LFCTRCATLVVKSVKVVEAVEIVEVVKTVKVGIAWSMEFMALGCWLLGKSPIREFVNSDHPPSLPWALKPLERTSLAVAVGGSYGGQVGNGS